MEKLIDMEHVTAAYGNKTVLRDISLTVWKDDFLGIIGRADNRVAGSECGDSGERLYRDYRTERGRKDDLVEGDTRLIAACFGHYPFLR